MTGNNEKKKGRWRDKDIHDNGNVKVKGDNGEIINKKDEDIIKIILLFFSLKEDEANLLINVMIVMKKTMIVIR